MRKLATGPAIAAAPICTCSFGFRLLGFEFRVWGVGLYCFCVLCFGFWVLGLCFGSWILGFGFWVLGFGFWVLGFGFWVLGSGFWVLGFGFWVQVLGFGVWGIRTVSWSPRTPSEGRAIPADAGMSTAISDCPNISSETVSRSSPVPKLHAPAAIPSGEEASWRALELPPKPGSLTRITSSGKRFMMHVKRRSSRAGCAAYGKDPFALEKLREAARNCPTGYTPGERRRGCVRTGPAGKEVETCGRVWGSGLGVQGLGFGVWGLGCGVWGLGFGCWGLWVKGLGIDVWGRGFGVWGCVFWVQGCYSEGGVVDGMRRIDEDEADLVEGWGLGCRIQVSGVLVLVQGLGFSALGLGFGVEGLGFRG